MTVCLNELNPNKFTVYDVHVLGDFDIRVVNCRNSWTDFLVKTASENKWQMDNCAVNASCVQHTIIVHCYTFYAQSQRGSSKIETLTLSESVTGKETLD